MQMHRIPLWMHKIPLHRAKEGKRSTSKESVQDHDGDDYDDGNNGNIMVGVACVLTEQRSLSLYKKYIINITRGGKKQGTLCLTSPFVRGTEFLSSRVAVRICAARPGERNDR